MSNHDWIEKPDSRNRDSESDNASIKDSLFSDERFKGETCGAGLPVKQWMRIPWDNSERICFMEFFVVGHDRRAEVSVCETASNQK